MRSQITLEVFVERALRVCLSAKEQNRLDAVYLSGTMNALSMICVMAHCFTTYHRDIGVRAFRS